MEIRSRKSANYHTATKQPEWFIKIKTTDRFVMNTRNEKIMRAFVITVWKFIIRYLSNGLYSEFQCIFSHIRISSICYGSNNMDLSQAIFQFCRLNSENSISGLNRFA